MNIARVALAALGAFVAYFALGTLAFAVTPLAGEFRKYPAVFRSQESIKHVAPVGMVAMLAAMCIVVVIYAMLYRGGSGLAEGARFGALIGGFVVCAFVFHNYVNLNVGLTLTIQNSVAYFVQWIVVGIVIGLIYRPL
jgi:hypothetical protein